MTQTAVKNKNHAHNTRWRKVAIKIKRWREAYAVGRVFYATFQELQVLRP